MLEYKVGITKLTDSEVMLVSGVAPRDKVCTPVCSGKGSGGGTAFSGGGNCRLVCGGVSKSPDPIIV